jgi:hypothetical protein
MNLSLFVSGVRMIVDLWTIRELSPNQIQRLRSACAIWVNRGPEVQAFLVFVFVFAKITRVKWQTNTVYLPALGETPRNRCWYLQLAPLVLGSSALTFYQPLAWSPSKYLRVLTQETNTSRRLR